jgi:peptidoglycan/LPS O-acetylase OafA/YrhL
MLPGEIDSLAIGALLAYASRFSRDTPLWKRFEQIRIRQVSVAADVKHDWRINWLGGRAIRHLGRISYSLYVFHLFVPQILPRQSILSWSDLTRFVILSMLSIAFAELSWQFIEKPINRFKSRIPPRRDPTASEPVPVAVSE